jgi:hypothetical protein
MSISYEEALSTLEAMFGAPWTKDTLDSVLRHHQGHMENTVDQILRYGDKDPQALVDQLLAGINPEESSVSQDEMLARQLTQESRASRKAPAAASAKQSGRGAPTALPPDFLRITVAPAPQSSSSSSMPGSQMADDEALARALQDELFTEELARNPDFAHLARGRSNAPGSASAARAAGTGRTSSRISERQLPPNNPMPNVIGKISELGDGAKRRLQMLAAQFNANRPGGGNTSAAQGSGNGGMGGSSGAAAERRGLLDGDDDMELAARKDL